MQRKYGAWDAGKRIACAYVSGTWQLLLACRRSGGRTFLRLCRRNTAGACPRRRAPWGHAVRPIPRGRPESTPPMIPKKSQRKYGRKNIKTGPCTPAGASIFLTGRLLLQLCPAAHTGIKGQTVCQSLGIFPGQGPPAPPARGTGQIHAVFIPQPQNILQLHNGQIGHGGK